MKDKAQLYLFLVLHNNNIEITLHYEEQKGHDGLTQEEAIYNILKI
jgi:hypothetical protein